LLTEAPALAGASEHRRMKMSKWYERKPERYKLEGMLISTHYPKARMSIERGLLVIGFRVQGRKAFYSVKVVYPGDFPYSEPRAYIIEPVLKGDVPHRWPDGHLSVHDRSEDVPAISGKIVIDGAIQWIKCFEDWLITHKWHGE
jgi:hypothetical protein